MLDAFDNQRHEWFDATAADGTEIDDDAGRVRLRCAACGHLLTSASQAVEIAGRLHHHATNPAGFSFRFQTFAAAPGCDVVGTAHAEHSWFPPARWQLAQCGACAVHCGWRFSAPAAGGFFALIEQCLVEDDES